jgi:predicted component of type VI protein secretion system
MKNPTASPTVKHTPGPWTAMPCPCGHKSCADAVVEPGVVRLQGACSMDDARLIAAAPDLLAALRVMVLRHEARTSRVARLAALDIARAAIAKAEGRA